MHRLRLRENRLAFGLSSSSAGGFTTSSSMETSDSLAGLAVLTGFVTTALAFDCDLLLVSLSSDSSDGSVLALLVAVTFTVWSDVITLPSESVVDSSLLASSPGLGKSVDFSLLTSS